MMVIAGCLYQARNILKEFDEILDGPAPKKLDVETHETIRKLCWLRRKARTS